jgi:hypothetical protein
MFLTLTHDHLSTVEDEGKLVMVTGTTTTGARIRFAGEHREMGYMLAEIASGQGPARVRVQSWQIIDARAEVPSP